MNALVVLFSILSILAAYFYFRTKNTRDYKSPLGLAQMFVNDLIKRREGQPLPEKGTPEIQILMKSLNILAQESKLQEQRIADLEKIKNEFVTNVSHELRTPLTSIRGYTETLKGGAFKNPEVCLRFLDRIEENSNRLSALISDLLNLAKLEKFPNEIEWAEFSASDFLQKIDSLFYPVLAKKNQKLKTSFVDPIWRGDAEKLEHVFTNLIDNASRYTSENSIIELIQGREEKYLHFLVKDNGPGIDRKHLNRLFERFYRVDKARSRDTGGTGLGLSICKHIVQSHGGQISVESEIGKGTTFIIRIPTENPFLA